MFIFATRFAFYEKKLYICIIKNSDSGGISSAGRAIGSQSIGQWVRIPYGTDNQLLTPVRP